MIADGRLSVGQALEDSFRALFAHLRHLPRLVVLPALLLFGVGKLQGLAWDVIFTAFPLGDDGLSTAPWIFSPAVSLAGLLATWWILSGVIVGWLRLQDGAKPGFLAGLRWDRVTLRCWGLSLCLYFCFQLLNGALLLVAMAANLSGSDGFNFGLVPGFANLGWWLSELLIWFPLLPLYIGFARILRGRPGGPITLLVSVRRNWWRAAVVLVALLAIMLLLRFLFAEFAHIASYVLDLPSALGALGATILRVCEVAVVATGGYAIDRKLMQLAGKMP